MGDRMIPTNRSESGVRRRERTESLAEISDNYIYDGFIYQYGLSDHLIHSVHPDVLTGAHYLKKEELMVHVREAAEKARATFVEKMETHLKEKARELQDEDVGQHLDSDGSSEEKDFIEKSPPRKRSEKHGKVFVPRESLLNKLGMNKNIQTLYNIFVAILCVIIINSLISEYLHHRRIGISLSLLVWCLDKVPYVLFIWCFMIMWATAGFYSLYTFWAHHPDPHFGPFGLPNKVWFGIYVVGFSVLLVYPPSAIISYNLPPGSTLVVVIEQIRIGMKIHGFMREVTPRAFRWKELHSGGVRPDTDVDSDDWHPKPKQNNRHRKEEKDLEPCPDFSLFLYFLFAPTLIYRNSYPMTPKIRWELVRQYFGQCIVSGLYMFYLVEYFCLPIAKDFASEPYGLKDILVKILGFMLPATLCLFLMFYLLLHAWMNAFAEMTRFADRQFYKDWWNFTSYTIYFRTWNIVVHDWLHAYVYRDLLLLGVRKDLSLLGVFVVSSIFHEYLLSLMCRFVYPVLLVIFFTSGVISIFAHGKGSPRARNTILWFSMFVGNGMVLCLYTLEWHARVNCPSSYEGFIDMVIPRTFSCSRFSVF